MSPGPAIDGGHAGPLASSPSRRERIAVRLERAADRHLSPVGVWVYRRTKGEIT